MEKRHAAIIETFSAEFMRAHEGHGFEAADPIFIVGLHRSGSTLIEQILASHSQVEGTSELPNLGQIAASLPEMHVWLGCPETGEVIDFTTGFWPAACKVLLGQDWLAAEPPAFTSTSTSKVENIAPSVAMARIL